MTKCWLWEAFRDVRDHTGYSDIDKCNIFHCFCQSLMTNIFNCLCAILYKHLVSILCHLVGTEQIDFIFTEIHLRLAVLYLDFFCHRIQNSGCRITDWTFCDHLQIYKNRIDFMFESPAVLLCAFRCIHNTHCCKCGTSCDWCRNIDNSGIRIFADCFCKIHNKSATDSDYLITVFRFAFFSIFPGSFIRTFSTIQVQFILKSYRLKSRNHPFFHCIPRSVSGNDKCSLSKTWNFFSTLFK